jgi:hypothetical protein
LLADAFQTRPGLAAAIDSALEAGSPAVVTQVVAGDGGTGKTQLAASAFGRALPGMDVAVWVSATSRQAVTAAFAEVWGLVHGAGGGDSQRDAAAFLTWLETTDRSWIVVLDDLVDPGDVSGLWPQGPSGRVLVTTRRRDAALAGHGRTLVDVGVYSPDEAMAFLTRKLSASPVKGVLDQAVELARDLGFLPLALAQAGAVILDGALTCTQYRRQLADQSHRLADLFDTDTGDEYELTLARTWTLAVARADALPPAGLAGQVLNIVAVMDPNGFPEAVLTASSVSAYLAVRRPTRVTVTTGTNKPLGEPRALKVSGDAARKAMRNLHRLSLVTHDPGGGARAVRMHALAQRATIEHLPPAELANTVRAAADGLLQFWPDTERDPELAQALRANATALAGRHPDALWEAGMHQLLHRMGRSLGYSGQVAQARDHYAQLAASAAAYLGKDHPDTMAARHEHARWCGTLGEIAVAIASVKELLADRTRVQGTDHRDTLVTRHELAYWRGVAGDAGGAMIEFERLLAEQLRVLGSGHPDIIETRFELARCQGLSGNPAGAVVAHERLLVDQVGRLGPDHPDTLHVRHSLAWWRGEAGDLHTAVTSLQHLLNDRLRIEGPDNPGTLATRGELAYWAGKTGDHTAAIRGFRELLADQTRVLGPNHPDTLITRRSLARWQGEAGDPEQAAASCEQLLLDQVRVLGPDHPDTLTTRCDLARWRGESGEAQRAAASFVDVLADRVRVLGPNHPDTLDTRAHLAYWQRETNQPGSEQVLQELLADRLRVLGPDHPDTLMTRQDLAQLQRETGDNEGAVEALEHLLADQLRVLGPDHPDTAASRKILAGWHDQVPSSRPGSGFCTD